LLRQPDDRADRAVDQARRVRQRGLPAAQAPGREGRQDPRRGARRVDDQADQGAGRVHRRRRRGPVQAGALPLLTGPPAAPRRRPPGAGRRRGAAAYRKAGTARRGEEGPMGALLVVEGVDGAGKNTLTGGLVARWRAAGLEVATAAFPRYGDSIHADLGAEAL